MNVNFKSVKDIKFLQEGGPMPGGETPMSEQTPEQASEQGGAQDQMAQMAQQLVEMLMQQIGDPQAVTAVLQMALEMVQGAGQPEPQAEPVYRKGGKLLRRLG